MIKEKLLGRLGLVRNERGLRIGKRGVKEEKKRVLSFI